MDLTHFPPDGAADDPLSADLDDNLSVITPSEFSDQDSLFADSSASSFLSSIFSSARDVVEENGRLYPSYGKYMYSMPIDERELDRNDMQHHKFGLMLEGRLYLAPIPQSIHRILDLGTGTGIWAVDMAYKHPSAEIVGVDIAPVQPDWVPPNCTFEIDDVEDEWLYSSPFDFIYGREFIMAIRDWPRLIGQAFKHLKPGGWFELSGTIPELSSDDNTIPENSQLLASAKLHFEMAEKMGAPLEAPRQWKRQLRDCGFVEVREVIFKIPNGSWPKDKRMRTIGTLERLMLLEGLDAYLMRGFTQILQRDPRVLEGMLAQAKEEIKSAKMHSYVFYHVVYGRKPEEPEL